MNCRSAEELFSSHIEDEISQEERRHLETHLMGCRRCSLALREMRATLTVLQREMPLVETSAHFEEDVLARIRSGEGLRPTALELIREILSPLRLRPAMVATAGVAASVLAFAVSPVGQGMLRHAAPVTASRVTTPATGLVSAPPTVTPPAETMVAERTEASGPKAVSSRRAPVMASAASAAPAVQDSVVDAPARPRYTDEIINDQFYLERGGPGQDPAVVPVNTSQDDGVYIVF